MTEETTTEETVETREAPGGEAEWGPPADEGTTENVGPDDPSGEDFETFGREYVEELREEAAGYRVRAKDRDDLAQRLHTSLVAATGRLADPTDLTFDEGHLEDPEALTAALEDLLTRKPHLASRKPRGDVGQGPTTTGEPVDLAAILRSRAS